jgi:hypothetical protein
MGCVDERPPGAKFRAVCWDDPEEIRRWLSVFEEQTNELHAAARDRVRKKRKRVLSRHEAGRKVRAAWRALTQLLEAAKAGLRQAPPVEPPPSPPPPPEESEAPLSERRAMQPPPGSEGA